MKTTLNKKERNAIYIEALVHFKKYLIGPIGLCAAIYRAVRNLHPDSMSSLSTYRQDHSNNANETHKYPELDKFNPHNNERDYWFPISDKATRIKILETCIKETNL